MSQPAPDSNDIQAIESLKKACANLRAELGKVIVGQKDAVDKVPFLGDLPGVGNLFKRKFNSVDKQEMLVFITPKVVADRAAR